MWKIKHPSSFLFNLLLLAISVWAVVSSLGWDFQAKSLPILIGCLLILLLLIILWMELRKGTTSEPSDMENRDAQPDAQSPAGEWKTFMSNAMWLVIFFGLLLILGFYASTLLFILGFSVVRKYAWYQVVLYAVLAPVLEWFVFRELFQINLWLGCIPEILPNIIGGDLLPPL